MKRLVICALTIGLIAASCGEEESNEESSEKANEGTEVETPAFDFEADVCGCYSKITDLMNAGAEGTDVSEELAFVSDRCAELEDEIGSEDYNRGIRDCQIAAGDTSVATTEITPCECYEGITDAMNRGAEGADVAEELAHYDNECGILREMMGEEAYSVAIEECAGGEQ